MTATISTNPAKSIRCHEVKHYYNDSEKR